MFLEKESISIINSSDFGYIANRRFNMVYITDENACITYFFNSYNYNFITD